MATAEDNAEVVPDDPSFPEENQEEKETQQTEEAADESKESETEKSVNQKEIETLQAQKEHWRKKAQDLEKKSKSVAQKTEDTSQSDDEFRPRVEFLLENRDLNADEYDHLAAVALRNSGKINLESLREAKKSEAEYIGYLRKKAESKSKLPGSTSASGVSRVQKTPEEIGKMTRDEHMRYEAQVMKENQGI